MNIKNKLPLLSFLVIFIFFFINTFHTNFPDEFDNIVGGYYITKGILPYKGFFSHHGPVSYYLASIITLFTGRSFVLFRLFLSFFLFGFIFTSYLLLKKRLSQEQFTEFLIFGIILGLSATYFWGHMLLADSLSGYLIIPVYIILLLKPLRNKKLTFFDIFLCSFLGASVFLTSITYTYLIIIINVYLIYLYFKQNNYKILSKKTFKLFLILAIPYIVFVGYLLATFSFKEFYQQTIAYNKNTYIYNYPRPEGSTKFNPLRYAIVITHQFYQGYYALLTQVKDFNLSYPFNITLAVINISLLVFLLLMGKFTSFFYVLLFLIFSNPRSSPLSSKETDFQSAVYIMISLFNLPFLISLLKEALNSNKINYSKRIIFTSLLLLTSFYSFFFLLFIGNNFFDKAYTKYMGTAPLIYDRPQVAGIINQLITANDYFWIGPHEFEELLYINGKLSSKYHWFLRAHSETENIKKEMMADLAKNKPKVIVFKRDYSEFGQNPNSLNSLMVNFLNNEYFQVGEIGSHSGEYKTKQKDLRNFNIDEQFYFDKERKEEIVGQLINLNIIERESAQF